MTEEISDGVKQVSLDKVPSNGGSKGGVETESPVSTTDEEQEDDEDDEADMSPMVRQLKHEEEMKRKEFELINNTVGMTVIPDSTPDVLPADADLTSDLPDDTDYIDLVHLKIRSIESLGLSRFSNLESLVLRDNLIESLNGLKELTCKDKLTEIDLYDNRIKHISKHVNELRQLTSLDLSFNNIKHVKHIHKLVNLENLYFVQNKIHSIENIETLQKLKNLEFGGNHIDEISETLLQLPTLEQLWLGQNKISKFQNLDNLSHLRILSIQSNRITKIEGLDGLVSLEELYLSHNKLTKLEGLDKLTHLNILDITGNKIQKLENMDHLTELTDFWASYNLIHDYDNIHDQLGGLPNLETIYLEGNPIQLKNATQYRTKLRLSLGKSLQKIDALYITTNRMVA